MTDHTKMPVKRKSKSARSSRSSAGGKKKGKKSARPKGSAKMRAQSAKEPRDVDMMSQPAMENLYYIAHGAVDALTLRGFDWPEAGGKGSKGGKKGKKKK